MPFSGNSNKGKAVSGSSLEEQGRLSFHWARRNTPLFRLAERFVQRQISLGRKENPFLGLRIAACLHVSKETAVLMESLNRFGAKILLVAANPLSSQPEIVAFLSSLGIEVRARRDETASEYEKEIELAAASQPDLIIDDGAELHVAYASNISGRNSRAKRTCFGGTDETTSGTIRLRALDRRRLLTYPVIAVNEAPTKHIFDNKYGTGQSTIDGLIRSTGLLLAGKVVVVVGFGWVGSGVAARAKGMGSRVIVTEVNPIRALEAHLEGFEVMRMIDAACIGEVFLTCTGQTGVITSSDIAKMRDGAILANVGHFEREIDVRSLFRVADRVSEVRAGIAEFEIKSQSGRSRKSIFLLNQGRVVNLASAEGHPPEIMQLSFANQLLSLHYLASRKHKSKKGVAKRVELVMPVPREIDEMVSRFALKAFVLKIDSLRKDQMKYSDSYH